MYSIEISSRASNYKNQSEVKKRKDYMSHDPRCFEVKLINVLKYVLTAYIICKKRKGWKKDWNTRLSIMNTKEKEKGQDQQENSNEVSWRERKERHTPQKSCNYNEWAERHLHDVFYGTEARMRSSFFLSLKKSIQVTNVFVHTVHSYLRNFDKSVVLISFTPLLLIMA